MVALLVKRSVCTLLVLPMDGRFILMLELSCQIALIYLLECPFGLLKMDHLMVLTQEIDLTIMLEGYENVQERFHPVSMAGR